MKKTLISLICIVLILAAAILPVSALTVDRAFELYSANLISAVIKGDLMGKGKATLGSFSLLGQYLLKTKDLTDEQKLAADMNEDGRVTMGDFALLGKLLLEGGSPEQTQPQQPEQSDEYSEPALAKMQKEGVDRVNELRASLGLPALEYNEQLCEAAQIRAQEMADTGVFEHIRPDGTPCFTVMTAPSPAGENIAANTLKNPAVIPQTMMEQWTDSPGHYANMTNSEFKQMGIGYALGKDGWWYGCQLFSGSGPVTVNG